MSVNDVQSLVSDRAKLRVILTEVTWYAFVGFISLVLTSFALDLFHADFTKPFEYFGDSLATAAHFKTVYETGWYEYQPLLGAPYGQTYNDFPTADNLHLIAAKILSLLSSNWVVGFNAYFVLGFPLAAIAAFWFFRKLKINVVIAVALSASYSIAPYHFQRGEAHLWLASYYVVPIAGVLLLTVLNGEKIWGWGSSPNRLISMLISPTSRNILCVALLGTASSYYSIFFIALLAISALFRFIRFKAWQPLTSAFFLALGVAIVMLINMAPDLYYARVNGINPSGLERSPAEVEYYGIKLTQLLLPWPGHRVSVLKNIRALYDGHYPLTGEDPALGLLGAIGLVIVLFFIAYRTLGLAKKSSNSRNETQFRFLSYLSFLTLVSLIFGITGGLSTVISFFTSSLRGWNRISILILLMCLGVLGICLEILIARAVKSRSEIKSKVAIGLCALLLMGVAFIDQTPSDANITHLTSAKAFDADQRWIDEIQAQVPLNAMILQLPYVPFPESSAATGVFGSEDVVPYLHSPSLKWSAGGIKGRPRADYPSALELYQPNEIALLSSASGFAGILIDKAALLDGGNRLLSGFEKSSLTQITMSESGRFVFINLQKMAELLKSTYSAADLTEIRLLVTDPPLPYGSPSFSAKVEPSTGQILYSSAKPNPQIRLINETETAVEGTLSFKTPELASSASVKIDGKEAESSWVSNTFNQVVESLPGKVIIDFNLNPADARESTLTISNLRFVPVKISRFLDSTSAITAR